MKGARGSIANHHEHDDGIFDHPLLPTPGDRLAGPLRMDKLFPRL